MIGALVLEEIIRTLIPQTLENLDNKLQKKRSQIQGSVVDASASQSNV